MGSIELGDIMTMSNGTTGGVFASVANLQASSPRLDTILQLTDGRRYSVSASNVGSGLLLANGYYANPISEPVSVITNTAISHFYRNR